MPQQPVEPEVTAAAAAVTTDAQSTSQEAATVQEQINAFESAPPQPALAVDPAPASPAPNDQAHEQLINEAASGLHTPSPEAEAAPAPTPASEAAGSKKTIDPPPPDPNKADLQTLLAQEEAQNQAGTPGGTVLPQPASLPVQPEPVPVATPAAQPVAATQPQPAAPAGAPQATPQPDSIIAPPANNVFMPNENGSANEHAL
jgi:hypothetical protein